MRRRTVVLLLGLAVLIGLAAFEVRRLWYRCGDEEVMAKLVKLVPRDPDGDGVIFARARLLAGQLFAFPYQCEADTTPIRSNVDLTKAAWQHIWYTVSTIDGAQRVSLFQP